ncbi:MAG: hypothetical protein E7464_00435 [Ruminococcaceae bacterium]|nr:hypothetical protein [Oscillospiraceae bacterium]
MNPYDRRAVRSVWARVMPGRDVFAPGAWPAPPPAGRGGVPPTPPRNPDDNKPPAPPTRQPPGQGGRPNPPGQGGWTPPPPPPPPPAQPSAATQLLELAAGYDALAMRFRSPGFRQMAAQCRRGESTLRSRCGIAGTYTAPAVISLQVQQEREAALRRALERLPEACTQPARQLARESQARSRQLARIR